MSDEGKKLAARFAPVGIQHHGVFLLRPYDAIRLVEEAEAVGVEVYGLDAFLRHPGEKIQPDTEFDPDGSHEASKAHLRRFLDGPYWFEVAFDDT